MKTVSVVQLYRDHDWNKVCFDLILQLLPPFAKKIDIESVRSNNQSYLSINMNKSWSLNKSLSSTYLNEIKGPVRIETPQGWLMGVLLVSIIAFCPWTSVSTLKQDWFLPYIKGWIERRDWSKCFQNSISFFTSFFVFQLLFSIFNMCMCLCAHTHPDVILSECFPQIFSYSTGFIISKIRHLVFWEILGRFWCLPSSQWRC